MIDNSTKATTFLYNLFAKSDRNLSDLLEKKAYSYQLHEAVRTLFMLIKQSTRFVQGIDEREIYNHFFNLNIVLGAGVQGQVVNALFFKEEGFVIKSVRDEELRWMKIDKKNRYYFTKLNDFNTVKTSFRESLFKEYIINRYVNSFNLPIFQQTYAFINCSRPIIDNGDSTTFCTLAEPGVIVSQKIEGPNLKKWLEKRSITRKEVIAVVTILITNLIKLYDYTGFTHYDLHPGNILMETYTDKFSVRIVEKLYVASRYIPKVIDFGYSRAKIGDEIIRTDLPTYGITDAPNLMYDIYKIIMEIVSIRGDVAFLTKPFFGKELTQQEVIRIRMSKARPIQKGTSAVFKDQYFILPDNFSVTVDNYFNFIISSNEIIDIVDDYASFPEYGLDTDDCYKELNINCEDYLFPVENLYQKYVFELGCRPCGKDLTSRRIKIEGNYYYEDVLNRYQDDVDAFAIFVSDSEKQISARIDIDKRNTITDNLYGSPNFHDIYIIIAKAVQTYSNLLFRKKVLQATKPENVLHNGFIAKTINLKFLKEQREDPKIRDIFDSITDFGGTDEFDPNLW